MQVLKIPVDNLSSEIVRCVEELNNGAPSAVFLAGGGSKLAGLKEAVAEKFNMDKKRVAIAGGNFKLSAFSDKYDLNSPEYATPLGIAVSSGLRLLHDSLQILLNGKPAKIFKSGTLKVIDVLMMNGYVYGHILGHSGKNVTVTVDGQKKVFYGERAVPAILKLNGTDASISDVVQAGDRVDFTPAVSGQDAQPAAADVMAEGFTPEDWDIYINGEKVSPETMLKNGDEISFRKRPEDYRGSEPPQSVEQTPQNMQDFQELKSEESEAVSDAPSFGIHVTLNDKPLSLPAKDSGEPVYLMDLLEYSELDFDNLNTSVSLRVNGEESNFLQEIKNRDIIEIKCDENTGL